MNSQDAASQKSIVIFSSSQELEYFQVASEFARPLNLPITRVQKLTELQGAQTENSLCLLIFAIRSASELRELMTFLVYQKTALKQGRLKVFGFSTIKDYRVETALLKVGVEEVLSISVSAKGFMMKLKRYHDLICSYRKPETAAPASLRLKSSEKNAPSAQMHARSLGEVSYVPALEIAQDYWSIQSTRDLVGINGTWSCEIFGPPPSQGKWVRKNLDVPEAPGAEYDWVWAPREMRSEFDPAPAGTWKFHGRKPEYLWRAMKWRLISGRLALYFESADSTVYDRLRSEADRLTSARNSKAGLKLIARIIELTTSDREFQAEVALGSTKDYHDRTNQEGSLLEYAESASRDDGENFFELPNADNHSLAPFTDRTGPSESDLGPYFREAAPTDEVLAKITENVALEVVLTPEGRQGHVASLVDLFDETVVLRTKESISKGTAKLSIEARLGQQKTSILMDAEILEDAAYPDDEGFVVTLRSKEISAHSGELLQILQHRQENVLDFISLAKGEA